MDPNSAYAAIIERTHAAVGTAARRYAACRLPGGVISPHNSPPPPPHKHTHGCPSPWASPSPPPHTTVSSGYLPRLREVAIDHEPIGTVAVPLPTVSTSSYVHALRAHCPLLEELRGIGRWVSV